MWVYLYVMRITQKSPPDVCPPQTLPNAVCGCRLRRQLVLGAKVAFRWTKVKWGSLFFNCALRIFFGFCTFKFSFFRTFANLMSECMNLGKVIFVLAALPHSRFVAISNAVFPFSNILSIGSQNPPCLLSAAPLGNLPWGALSLGDLLCCVPQLAQLCLGLTHTAATWQLLLSWGMGHTMSSGN